MMKNINNQFKWGVTAALIAAMGAMQGCASSPSKLSDDGLNDKIAFPDVKEAWVKGPVDPNVDNLRKITVGMTKDNVYRLLGHPHFHEGIIRVREWDYVFNFRNSDGTVSEVCQYKIVYAPDMLLRSTHWKPESCEDWLKPAAVPTQTVVERVIERVVEQPAPAQEVVRIRIAADGMFDFDKYELANLRPGGVEKLNKAVEQLLSGGEIVRLKIVGHTDRLGSDDYNMKLSEARANTIRQYLIGKHIPAERITTEGVGESQPLVECKQQKRDEALIRCLEPNRRFEIEAWVEGKDKEVK